MPKKITQYDNTKTLLRIVFYTCLFTLFAVFPVQVYIQQKPDTPLDLLKTFLLFYLIAGVGCTLFCIFIKLISTVWRWIDHDAIQTLIRILILRFSSWLRSRNIKLIYPRLQDFLFYVLTQNKNLLPLPIGNDKSCLTPFGSNHVYRNDCIFYRFQLILPEMPEIPISQLRKLLQHYILSESRNYGISNLYSFYIDVSQNTWDTVQVDRMWIDEENHLLFFEILYITSEKSVEYMVHVMQREQASQSAFYEVYDDEV